MTEKLAFTVNDAIAASSIGRDRIYDAIKSGKLRACRWGGKTLIRRADLMAFLDGLEPWEPAGLQAARSPR